MYCGKLRANPHFNNAVEKFSEHLQDSSSVDALIYSSLKCEFITCGILDLFIGGCISYYRFLHQHGNCIAFLKDVKQQLSSLHLEVNSIKETNLDRYSQNSSTFKYIYISTRSKILGSYRLQKYFL